MAPPSPAVAISTLINAGAQLIEPRKACKPTHEVGAGGSLGKMTDASSNFGARVAPPHGQNFYGTPARAKPEKEEQDVSTKSEKWLPALPSPQYDGWKNREQEILGFNEYLTTLQDWVALGSDTFPIEIEQAIWRVFGKACMACANARGLAHSNFPCFCWTECSHDCA